MNREDRRKFSVSKETSDRMKEFNAPCSIKEVIQISRASAEDVVEGAITDYQKRTSPLQVAMSLQMEIIKDTIIRAGLITEEEFKDIYRTRAEEFNEMQREYLQKNEVVDNSPKMGANVDSIDVKVER